MTPFANPQLDLFGVLIRRVRRLDLRRQIFRFSRSEIPHIHRNHHIHSRTGRFGILQRILSIHARTFVVWDFWVFSLFTSDGGQWALVPQEEEYGGGDCRLWEWVGGCHIPYCLEEAV